MEYSFSDKSVLISDIETEALKGFLWDINNQMKRLIKEKEMIEEELTNREREMSDVENGLNKNCESESKVVSKKVITKDVKRESLDCFGYIGECPLDLGYYTRSTRDRCYYAPDCWKDWFEFGGRLGYFDINEKKNEGN